jgi:NAD+ diphosphatase
MTVKSMNPIFSQNPLDRLDHLRGNILTQRLANLAGTSAQNPSTINDCYLLISKGKVLLDNPRQSCFFEPNQLPQKLLSEALCVFLGGLDGVHYYTLGVTDEYLEVLSGEGVELIDIRSFVRTKVLHDEQLGILAEANSLLSWHGNHGFCARCGSQSQVTHGGWRRDCPVCQTEHFPRTDPVVIMLVTYGDQCLLGRGHDFDEKRFSCLAGFMEPGETIAQAARRELWEEAGVKGGQVDYLSDQPWPFPSNLMIGVHVEAQNQQLNIDNHELAELIWVSKADVKAVLQGDKDKSFLLPPSVAIARNLLESWV